MAAKISTELKNEVKALREVCGVFIDLRKATEESLLAYLAANAINPEVETIEPEPVTEIKEEVEIELNEYWTKWSVAYSRLRSSLAPTPKIIEVKPEVKPNKEINGNALIGIAIALVIIEVFKVTVVAINWGKEEVVKRQLVDKGFSAAAQLTNQFKHKIKARGFATWA